MNNNLWVGILEIYSKDKLPYGAQFLEHSMKEDSHSSGNPPDRYKILEELKKMGEEGLIRTVDKPGCIYTGSGWKMTEKGESWLQNHAKDSNLV